MLDALKEVFTKAGVSVIVTTIGAIGTFVATKYSSWQSGVFYEISGPTDVVSEVSQKKLPFKIVTTDGKDVPRAYLYTVTVRNRDGDVKNLKIRYNFGPGDSNFKLLHFAHAANANPEFPTPKPLDAGDGADCFRRFEYESLKTGDTFSIAAVTTEPEPLHLYTHGDVELKQETRYSKSDVLGWVNVVILCLAVGANSLIFLRPRN